MSKRTYKRRTVSDAELQAALRWSSSRAEAAERLGVHRSTLHRWLREDDPAHAERSSRLSQYVALQTALENDPEVIEAWRPVAAYLRAIGDSRLSELIGDPRIRLRHSEDAKFCRLWDAFRAVEDRVKQRIESA